MGDINTITSNAIIKILHKYFTKEQQLNIILDSGKGILGNTNTVNFKTLLNILKNYTNDEQYLLIAKDLEKVLLEILGDNAFSKN